MREIKISIVVDNPDSWIMPYVDRLIGILRKRNHKVDFVQHHSEIKSGDIAFFLSCGNIVPNETLALNKNNIVVHESALPQGKGWSPLTWQILEGKNEIPITLFEAVEKVDAGRIYFQDAMNFEGHELIEELHDSQGKKTIELCLKFVECYPGVNGEEQKGNETFYPCRKPRDSKVDVSKTIEELFNNFRVADNARYPVYFDHKGYRYILKIEKVGRASDSGAINMTPEESYEAETQMSQQFWEKYHSEIEELKKKET